MKQPSLRHLKIDQSATRKIRSTFSKNKRVTITLNLDAKSIQGLKSLSEKTGLPYQRLLNSLVAASATGQGAIQTRLDRLEQEIRKIKRRFAA